MKLLAPTTALIIYALFLGTTFLSCQTKRPVETTSSSDSQQIMGEEVEVWGTVYHINKKAYPKDPQGIPVLDAKGNKITSLSERDFCSCAMEGSCKVVNGETIMVGYHKQGDRKLANCRYSPSGYATFFIDKNIHGTGYKGNPLFPHFSVACDQRRFKFGQWFYIPAFKGVPLPNGGEHEGYFRCDDVGGLIKGNHLDFFIGKTEDWKNHPFLELADSKKGLKAYLVEGKQ